MRDDRRRRHPRWRGPIVGRPLDGPGRGRARWARQRPLERALEIHRRQARCPGLEVGEVRLRRLACRPQYAPVIGHELDPAFPQAMLTFPAASPSFVNPAFCRRERCRKSQECCCHAPQHSNSAANLRGRWSRRCSAVGQGGAVMPEKRTIERARRATREGKAPGTQAGEFVREEVEHVREGKHGARSAKQAIAIGLSKARRAGVKLPPPRKGATSERTRKQAVRSYAQGQKATRRAT